MRCAPIAKPAMIATRKAFENAIASVAATGGSTNAVLHLLAMAREAGVELTIDDFQTISARTPLLVDLKPAGRFVAVDVDKAGGMGGDRASGWCDGGYAHGDAHDGYRPDFRRGSRRRQGDTGQEVIRPLDQSDQGDRRPGDPEGQPGSRGRRDQGHRDRSEVRIAARLAYSSAKRTRCTR